MYALQKKNLKIKSSVLITIKLKWYTRKYVTPCNAGLRWLMTLQGEKWSTYSLAANAARSKEALNNCHSCAKLDLYIEFRVENNTNS